MRKEVSCGAVIFTRVNGELKYVIIRSLEGVYGFPKGHMEGSETERETALREISEEVGLSVRLLPGFRTEDAYPLPWRPRLIKRVIYFLATYDGSQPLRPLRSELSGAALMSRDEALAVFRFDGVKRILQEADEYIRMHIEADEAQSV